MLNSYFDDYARDYAYYKDGAWCYEDGCLYRGLIALHEATGDNRWLAHLRRLVDGQIDSVGNLRGYAIEEFNIDNILSGRALIYLFRLTGDERYRKAIEAQIQQLRAHPRISAGCHWHKLRYPHQVWLDGLYMSQPFKAEAGALLQMPSLVQEAVDETLSALDLTFDPPTGLYRHGYDERRLQAWAHPTTGLSSAHWGRAIGWMSMALVDLVAVLPEGQGRERLADKLSALLSRLAALRTADGRWLQVVDDPDLPGNYAESSATAMFAYVFQKAERLGIAGVDGDIGRRALSALELHALKSRPGMRPVLGGICCVAGLGGFSGRYRDGSAAYYITEELRDDDIKGVGPMMMAYAEQLLERQTHRAVDAVTS
ncbi:glycoside hydrolase family 88 protein [Rhizobium sp. RU36D]|uniref:glycoside hydrolase family 88/105 protein n=1 Tax=Rhizobium sp. RU36D TaxID=1907415 RepID=UPI0009D86BAF|nr:glycoside hydrolase family 88 protein [Rhizobium sp. RU36D]SMC45166.1 unsaturated rhamnogalacturonyl hydrolase [Rhizobium sp. RU36D]